MLFDALSDAGMSEWVCMCVCRLQCHCFNASLFFSIRLCVDAAHSPSDLGRYIYALCLCVSEYICGHCPQTWVAVNISNAHFSFGISCFLFGGGARCYWHSSLRYFSTKFFMSCRRIALRTDNRAYGGRHKWRQSAGQINKPLPVTRRCGSKQYM